MDTPVRLTIIKPDVVAGSAPFTITVTVTNVSQADVAGVEVRPLGLPGRLLGSGIEVTDSKESELESRRRELIDEMESQVAIAYESQLSRSMPVSEQFAFALARSLDIYAAVFSGRRAEGIRPSWTRQAFRIYEWQDVETLEREIIGKEKPDSRLRTAFLIDKEKLRVCLDALKAAGERAEAFDGGTSLVAGASASFPFTARAPHLFARRDFDAQFQVSYRGGASGKFTSESVSARLTLLPSAFAVPTGGLVGGACGYAIRLAFSTTPGQSPVIDWTALGGSVLLGLVFALLTARKPDAHKVITVEDFLGGFIIGVLTGMFSDAVMSRLRTLFVGAAT